LRRWPGVPGALIVLVLGVAGASLPGFAALGIAQAGPAPLLLEAPVLPGDPAQWLRLVPLAAPLVLILFAESWGTMRSLALARGKRWKPTASSPRWAWPMPWPGWRRACRWARGFPPDRPTRRAGRPAAPPE
jgi:hypothetical protein